MNLCKYSLNFYLVVLAAFLSMHTPAMTQAKKRRMKTGEHCGRQRHFWHRVNTCMVGFRDLLDEYHVQQKQEPSMIDMLVMALGLKKLCRGYEEMLMCLHVVLSKCSVANNKHMKKLQRQLMPLRGRMDAFCNPRRIEQLQDNLFNRLKTRNSTEVREVYAKVEGTSGNKNDDTQNNGVRRPKVTTQTTTTSTTPASVIIYPSQESHPDHKQQLRQFVLHLPGKAATEKDAPVDGNTQGQWAVLNTIRNTVQALDTTTAYPTGQVSNKMGTNGETDTTSFVNTSSAGNDTRSNSKGLNTATGINTYNNKNSTEESDLLSTVSSEPKTLSSTETETDKVSATMQNNNALEDSEIHHNKAAGHSYSLTYLSLYSTLIVTVSLIQTMPPL
ncbi:uncharacterized protein LOC106168604 [Lingula anatina]|uniref:Uncharacterized protein LOC106168604 n=1 Tax=Lingula anatina TaxID=7574 RepID=A0A1S3IYA9_LINAN|nr:uncharacterized protein LOC106168604 [Lingula anatina]|eukprot:XP_013403187.1 uncharacterized protein LOC106168604 [Lingula anatina]